MEKDIVDILWDGGFGVVEGKDAVLAKIDEIGKYCEMMEEMANAPKEEHGKRQPGERCMYEIQRSSI